MNPIVIYCPFTQAAVTIDASKINPLVPPAFAPPDTLCYLEWHSGSIPYPTTDHFFRPPLSTGQSFALDFFTNLVRGNTECPIEVEIVDQEFAEEVEGDGENRHWHVYAAFSPTPDALADFARKR